MSVDLRTRYLGLELAHPLVASASPLSSTVEGICRLEEGGASAVVVQSLFEEQIESESLAFHEALEAGSDSFGEALTYLPELEVQTIAERYLDRVARARERVAIPVIGSLNGISAGGWIEYAKLIEQAGADALELNVYRVEADATVASETIEREVLELVRAARATVRIPLAVKIGPFHTSTASFARRLDEAGADGLVLFNRFVQPDIDLETLSVVPQVHLSSRDELLLPLRWVAILCGRVDVSLAASGGVYEAQDAVKLLLAGADAVMSASALLRRGPGRLGELVAGVRDWLEQREYVSVEQLKGSMSQAASPDPAAFERASYVKALTGWPRTMRA